ncbi:helix-turn-helix transcriptional regulator [Donghicola sp. XS_ASV15]
MQYVDDQTSLIQSLFSAATGAGWQEFLTRLRTFTQSDAAILRVDRANGVASYHAEGAVAFDLGPLIAGLRYDRVYSQEDLSSGTVPNQFFRILRVKAGTGGQATLCIARAPHKRDFRSPDRQFLTAITPYLGQCVAAWQAQIAQVQRTQLCQQLSATHGTGWVQLDPTGHILSMSDDAPNLRAFKNMRIAEKGRLEFTDPELALKFRTAFTECTSGSRHQALFAPEIETEVTVIRDQSNIEPQILVLVREAQDLTAIEPKDFADHFGLNRNEARLAALICAGHSLKSAAQALGWTDETARSYSKSIFARMGVQGQTGLLRRVLTSGVIFGPLITRAADPIPPVR